MLLYYVFWMLMGFILHFYIIFGTNLLIGGPAQIAVFAYFRVSKKRNIKRSPNGKKPSGTWFSQQTWSRRLGVGVKKQSRRPQGRGCAYPLDAPSTLGGPSMLHRRTSSSYIYPPTPKHPGAPRKPNSTAATFCTREIPSQGLFRSSAGGGIDQGGPLHQLHGLSGDVWVVYFRPTGP